MERPSFALMGAFCIAQLISSIIAAYGDWGFTQIEPIEGGWIGIIWIWVSPLISPVHRHSSLILSTTGHNLVPPYGLDQVRNEGHHHQVSP